MVHFLQSAFLFVVPFVFVLSLVVVIHELGHYWAARLCGTAIDQFSIGFGRSIVHWRDKHGVDWRIGWIPLGGFVRFSGDENAASVPDQDDLETLRARIAEEEGAGAESRYFQFKPIWQRAFITVAGPLANFLLAIAIFATLAMALGEPTVEPRIRISSPGGPGEVAGLRDGDVIQRMNGKAIRDFGDLVFYTRLRANTPIHIEVLRDGRPLAFDATPVQQEIVDPISGKTKVGMLGLGIDPRARVTHNRMNPINAVAYGADRTWSTLSSTVFYLSRVVTGRMPADQIGSVLGIADTSGKVARMGAEGATNGAEMLGGALLALIQLAALLSVSVGLMNLLPLPILDGGHLLFYAYEAVARRPLPVRIQAVGYRLGLALLVSFMLFATWNDLQRLRVFNFLGGLFS
jgi:regulator of sigma E protease